MDANSCCSSHQSDYNNANVLGDTSSTSDAKKLMIFIENIIQKIFTLHDNGYSYENSSIRLLFLQQLILIAHPIGYFLWIERHIYLLFDEFVIVYH